eukprot:4922654-Prymnesium_polylepis.2
MPPDPHRRTCALRNRRPRRAHAVPQEPGHVRVGLGLLAHLPPDQLPVGRQGLHGLPWLDGRGQAARRRRADQRVRRRAVPHPRRPGQDQGSGRDRGSGSGSRFSDRLRLGSGSGYEPDRGRGHGSASGSRTASQCARRASRATLRRAARARRITFWWAT